jgi:hypothetical protein
MKYQYNQPLQASDDSKSSLLQPLIILVLLIAAVASFQFVDAQRNEAAMSPLAYKEQLKAQVDTENGAPRSGRDPSTQGQTSLASVASLPSGIGMQTDKPAAGVVGKKLEIKPSQVLRDPKKSRVLSNGCLLDYGTPGADCLPAASVSANNANTCAVVKKYFTQGVKVAGTDTLNLDKNKDGVACGTTE